MTIETQIKEFISTEVNKHLQSVISEISSLHKKLDQIHMEQFAQRTLTSKNSVAPRNAGMSWGQIEEDLILEQLRNALITIANRHGRSFNAILCRIRQENLLDRF